MRVLHVTRDFPPLNNGGLSTAVGGMVEALVLAGVECSVVSFDNYRPKAGQGDKLEISSTEQGVHVLRLESAACLEEAQRQALSLGADIVHVHHELLWEFGVCVAKALSAATAYTVHVLQSEQDRLRGVPAGTTLSAKSQQVALDACDVVVCPSRAVATLLEGRVCSPLRVARLGIKERPSQAWAARQERDYTRPLLLYVGRFADINGFQELLQALPALLLCHPTLAVKIAGGLPGNARSERRWSKRIAELAQSHPGRVEHVGWVNAERLAKLYAQASIVVVPSWFETFGQVAAEAMLHGAPLVSTKAGALAELVSEETAITIRAQSSSAIVDGVAELLAEPALASQRSQRASESQRLHWHNRIQETIAVYDELIVDRRTSHQALRS